MQLKKNPTKRPAINRYTKWQTTMAKTGGD